MISSLSGSTTGSFPYGMAFAADGRAFVCTTVSGGVTIIPATGDVQSHIELGEYATNCAFDGSTLYVTAARAVDINVSERTSTLWAVETDARGGLQLIRGMLSPDHRGPDSGAKGHAT